jgi:YD repeat-containing protein
MKTALIQLLVPCLLVLISCGSDDPADNIIPDPPAEKKCLLQTQVTPSTTWTITRNSKGLVTTIYYAYKFENIEYFTSSAIEYDNSDRVIKIIGEDYELTYEYNSQGKIILEKYSAEYDPSNPNSYSYQRSYAYNASGFLVKIEWDAKNYERYEYDSNGNLIKQYMQTSSQSEYLRVEYLSYDDKKGVYMDFPFQSNTYLGLSQVYGIVTTVRPFENKNNITSMKIYQADGSSTTQNIAYSYNDSGYPTSITGMNVSFTYECK